ncbi:MAG TPA: hypothetical protein VK753_07945 [Xanthomonadaceae bacterium]|nr:hypothetical protein [Xanthomonadaceae bacterium]
MPAVDEGLARMAGASHYDDSFGVSFRAWEDAFRRYPPAAISPKPTTESIDFDGLGQHVTLLKWTDPKTMDDIDLSPAGAANVLVDQGPHAMHGTLARACDRATTPAANSERFEHCRAIGRMLLEHSNFLLERFEGAIVLHASETAGAGDIANARALRWQFEKIQTLRLDQDPVALDGYLTAYDAANSEISAIQHALQQAHIPLDPPATWQPTRDGKVINPLGEWHPSKEER